MEPADVERQLPDGLTIARQTPTWTPDSVPAALLSLHHTTVWAELVVEAGTVDFHEMRGGDESWSSVAAEGRPVVIVPNRKHRIAPSADAQFHVRFYNR